VGIIPRFEALIKVFAIYIQDKDYINGSNWNLSILA
jgi:hypothetical protein